MKKILEGLTGKNLDNTNSKTAARMDFLQSATGLFLILFMIVHTFLVSSILVSEEFMHKITIFFEGQYFFGKRYPIIVSGIAVIVLVVVMLHAWIAVRKFPNSSKEYKIYRSHQKMMKHKDTKVWFYQVMTGFFIFFFVLVHIFVMISKPDTIGPYMSSSRVYDSYYIVYGILLLLVEVHMMMGFYKLCLKWGWFDGKNPKKTRKILKNLYYIGEIFLLSLGIVTLIVYYRIGKDLEERGMKGVKYETRLEHNTKK